MEDSAFLDQPILGEWINPKYLSPSLLEQLNAQFSQASPFPHLFLDDFLVEEKLGQLIENMSEVSFYPQESDLFKLAQTGDFDTLGNNFLLSLKDFFRSEPFLKFMQSITGVTLTPNIDMQGNMYQDTDFLLCHDDKLEGRKIAYILYLTTLNESQGGALRLYDCVNEYPYKIVKEIYPKINRFAFFKVIPTSFHDVGEVIKPNTFRVTVLGWFND